MWENESANKGTKTLFGNVLYLHIHSRTLHVNRLISDFGLLKFGA